jgi:transposase
MVKFKSYYSPQLKQLVVDKFLSSQPKKSFRKIEREFEVGNGNGKTVGRWVKQYNGNIFSLMPIEHKGRPTNLTKHQVNFHIKNKIDKKNKRARPINYSTLYDSLPKKIRKQISLRQVQRIGRETLKGRKQKCVKRTLDECSILMHIVLFLDFSYCASIFKIYFLFELIFFLCKFLCVWS